MICKKSLIPLSILYFIFFDGAGQNHYDYKYHPVSTRVYDEVAPVLIEGGMVYSCNKPYTTITNQKDEHGYFLDLYFSERNEDGKWERSRIFSENLRFPQHDGMASFNFSQNLVFFTRTKESPDPIGVRSFFTGRRQVKNPDLGLYFSEKNEEDWGNPREFPYNESNSIHPCLSPMGDMLYFSSDREGGFGGYDIYVSHSMNGVWGEPRNLGPVINSSGDEIFPWLHSSGRLYFSSDAFDNGAGGFDIFYSDLYKNRWYKPVKLPTPFNSGLNDFTFYADDDLKTGFFSSNRRGSLDIFSFELNLPTFDICKKQVEDVFCYLFYEKNTVSLDTSLYLYEWNLGDDTKIRAKEAEHCYAGPGDYIISLNVVDKLTGEVAFNQAEYLIEARKTVQPYISCPDSVKIDVEVQMDGLESWLGQDTPAGYYWDFGDGTMETGPAVLHSYKSPGRFRVRLGILSEAEDPEDVNRYCSYKTIVVFE